MQDTPNTRLQWLLAGDLARSGWNTTREEGVGKRDARDESPSALIDAFVRAKMRGVAVRFVTDTDYFTDPRYAPAYREMAWRTNTSVEPGRSLWICPANPRRSNGNNLFHYCLNEHVNGSGTGNQVRLSSVNHPVRVIWLFDNGKLAAVAQQNNVHTNLHSRGAQFTFLDGHSARFRSFEYWDHAANQGRTNNPNLVWIP